MLSRTFTSRMIARRVCTWQVRTAFPSEQREDRHSAELRGQGHLTGEPLFVFRFESAAQGLKTNTRMGFVHIWKGDPDVAFKLVRFEPFVFRVHFGPLFDRTRMHFSEEFQIGNPFNNQRVSAKRPILTDGSQFSIFEASAWKCQGGRQSVP
jgi:hypothetical protein